MTTTATIPLDREKYVACQTCQWQGTVEVNETDGNPLRPGVGGWCYWNCLGCGYTWWFSDNFREYMAIVKAN